MRREHKRGKVPQSQTMRSSSSVWLVTGTRDLPGQNKQNLKRVFSEVQSDRSPQQELKAGCCAGSSVASKVGILRVWSLRRPVSPEHKDVSYMPAQLSSPTLNLTILLLHIT